MTEEATNIDEFKEEGTHEVPEASQEAGTPDRDFEAEAREMGWKPKEEWSGPADQWRDAEEFVKRGEEIFTYVKRDRDREREKRAQAEKEFQDRLKRLEQANRQGLELQKRQYEARIKEIEAREEKAVEEGDLDTYKALKAQREQLGPAPEIPEEPQTENAPDPTVAEWANKAENVWFHTDDAARAVAIQAAGKVANNGGDVQAQIRAAEAEVRRRFPEHFGETKQRQTVETGGQAPRQRKAKGVANLPREARDAFDQFVRMGVYKKEDLPKYAEAYWAQEDK